MAWISASTGTANPEHGPGNIAEIDGEILTSHAWQGNLIDPVHDPKSVAGPFNSMDCTRMIDYGMKIIEKPWLDPHPGDLLKPRADFLNAVQKTGTHFRVSCPQGPLNFDLVGNCVGCRTSMYASNTEHGRLTCIAGSGHPRVQQLHEFGSREQRIT